MGIEKMSFLAQEVEFEELTYQTKFEELASHIK